MRGASFSQRSLVCFGNCGHVFVMWGVRIRWWLFVSSFFFFWASPASDPPASPLPVVGSPGRCARCARSAVAGIQTPALRHALSQLPSMVHSPPIGSGVLSGRYLISYDMRAAHRLKTLMHYYERSMYCRFLSCRFLVCIPQQLTR